jgi:hypothetical protein
MCEWISVPGTWQMTAVSTAYIFERTWQVTSPEVQPEYRLAAPKKYHWCQQAALSPATVTNWGFYLSYYHRKGAWDGSVVKALRCATSRTVPGSIPGGVTGIFSDIFPSDRTMALGSTRPLVKMSTKNIPGGKGGRSVRVTTSPPLSAECHENLGA